MVGEYGALYLTNYRLVLVPLNTRIQAGFKDFFTMPLLCVSKLDLNRDIITINCKDHRVLELQVHAPDVAENKVEPFCTLFRRWVLTAVCLLVL